MMKKLLLPTLPFIFSSTVSFANFDDKTKWAMGGGLYLQKGSNSCSFCHGDKGSGGNVKEAANLSHPKDWKSYKALGGDAAYKGNKAEFLKQLQTTVVHLIQKGATTHNALFKPSFKYDAAKAGGPINGQMMGLTGAPSQAWMRKYKERGVTAELAAEAAYIYVQSLDTQGIFK